MLLGKNCWGHITHWRRLFIYNLRRAIFAGVKDDTLFTVIIL